MTIDISNLLAIHTQALESARQASQDYIEKHGEPYYCGFAWVKIRVKGSTKMGKALKTIGFKLAWDGGLDLWNPSGHNTQSMDVKEAGAYAYAEVMRGHGIDCYARSRPD
jgi:hypothetical protein